MLQINGTQRRLAKSYLSENQNETLVANYAGRYTSAISASVWSSEQTQVTIASESNTDHTATCVASASDTGCYRVTNKVTLADGSIDEMHFDIIVQDNSLSGSPSDYLN